jgi:hypothetical protein
MDGYGGSDFHPTETHRRDHFNTTSTTGGVEEVAVIMAQN